MSRLHTMCYHILTPIYTHRLMLCCSKRWKWWRLGWATRNSQRQSTAPYGRSAIEKCSTCHRRTDILVPPWQGKEKGREREGGRESEKLLSLFILYLWVGVYLSISQVVLLYLYDLTHLVKCLHVYYISTARRTVLRHWSRGCRPTDSRWPNRQRKQPNWKRNSKFSLEATRYNTCMYMYLYRFKFLHHF